MPAKMLPVTPASASAPLTGSLSLRVSLAPLLTHGQAALAPDLASGILKMVLSQIILLWHNAFNEVTIRRADDLFACAAREGRLDDPIPKGAELVQATFDVQFIDSPKPHAVNLAPPNSVTFQNPEDAPRLLPLLARRGFSAG